MHFAYCLSSLTRRSLTPAVALLAVALSPILATAQSVSSDYVRRSLLWSRSQRDLRALGNRLEVSGKERITLTGTVTRASGTNPVVVIWELPGRLRVEETSAGVLRVLAFDGARSWTSTGTITPEDQQLFETLLNDSAERFFIAQMQGAPRRFLGEGFRIDDGRTAGYSGPFYDVYEVNEAIRTAQQTVRQKFYAFNAATGLLDRVRYDLPSSGTRIPVEVRVTWRGQDGQQVPSQIIRSQGGQPTLTFVFTAAVLTPRVVDGIFTNP